MSLLCEGQAAQSTGNHEERQQAQAQVQQQAQAEQ
jgi:hypothetical protein